MQTRMISILMRLLSHTPFHGLHQQPGRCRAELPIHRHLYRPRSKAHMLECFLTPVTAVPMSPILRAHRCFNE